MIISSCYKIYVMLIIDNMYIITCSRKDHKIILAAYFKFR